MKNFLKIFVSFTFLSFLFLFSSCDVNKKEDQKEQPKEYISSNWEVMPENNNTNLKYFGYFHTDGFLSQGAFFDEIYGMENSNVLMLNSSRTKEVLLENLASAKAHNHKAIVSLSGQWTGGKTGQANSAVLVENWEQTLIDFKNNVQSYIDDGTILGFYLDEPAWNGKSEEDFRAVTKWVRDNCPNTKMITTMTVYDIGVAKREGYPELNASYNEFCTDVMYDSYAAWNDETRRTYLDALKSKALQNQDIWGCPRSFADNPEQLTELFKSIKGMYTEAIQEPRYVGIVCFSWADGLEGDWGYGLTSLVVNDSEYYNSELKKLYVDIGREVIGLPKYDHSKTVDITLDIPSEVYEIGEKVTLPPAGAVDGSGNELEITYQITSPSGKNLEIKSFVATESGSYEVKVTVIKDGNEYSKTGYISVRYPGEISTFDTPAHAQDALGGTDADIWCWPSEISTDIKYSGNGSLKVKPHATDGTWPRVVFNRNGYRLWDVSNADSISFMVYNPSDTPIKTFGLMVGNEEYKEATTHVFDIPSKVWTKVEMSIDEIKMNSPKLNLQEVCIYIGNVAPDYQNRSVFYIDDVKINQTTLNNSFEENTALNTVTGTPDDVWTWPVEISSEYAKTGTKSLKIVTRVDGGTWPNVVFLYNGNQKFDLTNIDFISINVYNPSDSDIPNMGLKINNGDKVNEFYSLTTLKTGQWTEINCLVSSIKEKVANFDLTNAYISFSQCGGTYDNKTVLYLDDFIVGKSTKQETEDNGILSFENSTDINLVGGDESDVWGWPRTISAEQYHTGTKALKVTPHPTDCTWPNVVFLGKDAGTWNLTNAEKITLWVFFDSNANYDKIGLKVNNGEGVNQACKTFNLVAGQWTMIEMTIDEIMAQATSIDLEHAKISLCQLGGTYDDRSPFYLDDFSVTMNSAQPEPAEEGALSFEESADSLLVGGTADDLWSWPRAVSTEQAHTGSKSLKVTPHATDGTWPNVMFKSDAASIRWNLTNASKITLWIYFDSNADYDKIGFKVNNGENVNQACKTFNLVAGEWTKIEITIDEILAQAASIDLENALISICQLGGTYDDRSPFYLDDFSITMKPAPHETDENCNMTFENDSDMNLIGGTVDDVWCWPRAISSEQAYNGTKSLKVTPHATDGTWPNIIFKSEDAETWNFTNATKITLWVYFDGNADYDKIGFKVNNGENVNQACKTFNLVAGEWTKIEITIDEILAQAASIDLEHAKISLCQLGGSYDDRSPFYLDDFSVINK